MIQEVVVKKSRINGLGIFAGRDFKKDPLVIKWSAHRELSKQDVENLSKADKEHVSFIDDKYVLVPPMGGLTIHVTLMFGLADFCYFAERDIKKGEEITADYRKESEAGFQMKCNCGSKNCKGSITVG